MGNVRDTHRWESGSENHIMEKIIFTHHKEPFMWFLDTDSDNLYLYLAC